MMQSMRHLTKALVAFTAFHPLCNSDAVMVHIQCNALDFWFACRPRCGPLGFSIETLVCLYFSAFTNHGNLSFCLLNYYYSFTHMCIHCCLGYFSPLLPSPTLCPLSPSVPGRSCSAFITNFVEEKRQV
jgi:hypothetical protein